MNFQSKLTYNVPFPDKPGLRLILKVGSSSTPEHSNDSHGGDDESMQSVGSLQPTQPEDKQHKKAKKKKKKKEKDKDKERDKHDKKKKHHHKVIYTTYY